MKAGAMAAAAALLAACGRPEAAAPRELSLAPADTLVTEASAAIGMAYDLAVDARGAVYVLDHMLHRVLVVPREGGAPRAVGRRGSGPGELSGPVAVAVDGDSVRVADRGNARVQVFTLDGRVARSLPVSEQRLGSGTALSPKGRMAFTTLGVQDAALVRVAEPDGRASLALGKAAARRSAFMDFTAIKRQIAQGNVPVEMRDHARAVPSDGGGAWLILLAEPAVARYAADGNELWRTTLRTTEMEAIRDRFFRVNRGLRSPSAIFPLSYVTDAVEADDRLWVLVDTGEEGPVVLLVVEPDGSMPLRLKVPGVTGARQLAVDAAHRRLHLVLASTDLVSVPLPAELFEPS